MTVHNYIIISQSLHKAKRNAATRNHYTKWTDTGIQAARFNFMCKWDGKRRIVEIREA